MNTSRRNFLKRVTAACALGLMTGMQASLTFARNVRATLDRVKGTIVNKNDPYYESWRQAMTWYIRKPARYPKTMLLAETVDDIVAAVNYARENDLRVSVRSTGHSISASPLRDQAVMIDLSRLRDADIDAETQTAWVQPGMRSQEFMDLVNKEELAFPTAHTSIVGLGGFLLGGGLGWKLQKWNMSCHSVIGAEIVLADGNRVRVTDSDYPDLLWAIRGVGPGFFGVVVRYRVKLYPLPKAIKKSTYVLTEEHLPMVAQNLERLASEKDEKNTFSRQAWCGYSRHAG